MTSTKKTSAAAKATAAASKATARQKVTSAKTVGANLSEADIAKARRDGAIEAEKEAAKASYTYATDGNLPGEEGSGARWPGKSEVMQFAHLINLGVEEFEAAVADDADPLIAEDKVAGLLELERSGQNRTPYVQALMKRLGVDSPYEVTAAGPGFTNDVRPVTQL